MKRLILFLLALTVLSCLHLRAQNSIDRLVDQYSSVGNSKYTSAVQRDPETGRVVRVVKMLSLPDQSVVKFKSTFQAEASTGDVYTETNGNAVTTTLIVSKPQTTRIYTLKYSKSRYPCGGQTTIIIKYNQKQ